MEILWLVAIVLFIVLEAITYQMICVWFIAGAVGGLTASLAGASFLVQMIVFVVLSVLLLVLFRPIAIKKLKTDFKTNADAVIGKTVTVTQEIDNIKGTGEAKLNGQTWTARTDNGSVLDVGDTAEVKRIEGVKLIVSKL